MKVLVVGAGLAGTLAAARAHALGAQVVVFAHRPGASALHGGGWEIGGPALLAQGLPPDRLEEALSFAIAGLPGLGLLRGPFVLPDTDGVLRPVDLAPASHAELARWRGPFAAVALGPTGQPFAEQLPGVAARLEIDYPAWPGAFGRSFAAVAARLDQPGEPARLAEALAQALAAAADREPSALSGLLLPPVLGLADPEATRAAVSAAVGLPLAEALGGDPPTPGLRLHRALEAWLGRLEIPVRRGRVDRVEPAAAQVELEGRIESGDAVILATGGRLSGGLTGAPTEPLAGLPVRPRPPRDLAAAVRGSGPYWGRLFEGGLRVDHRQRVRGLDGGVIDGPLFAAGDLLSGPDPLVTHCASGRAVLSGYLAGEHAALGGGR